MPAALEPEPTLHVFSLAGEEWYVALDREDAKKIIELMTGITIGPGDSDEFMDDELWQVNDGDVLKARGNKDGRVACEDDPHDPNHPIMLIFTAEVWCRREGRGLLFGSNH